MDVWDLVRDDEGRAALRALTEERSAWLNWKPFQEIQALWPQLPEPEPAAFDVEDGQVVIGTRWQPEEERRQMLERAARAVMPWKKGPFCLQGIHIDAEWRSDYKWDRFADALPDQKDRVVLDVGCNNGYYLFRLLPQQPRFMLGLDPVPRLHYQYHLLQHYARIPNLAFQMWGWQELEYFESCFDTIFCMGILYHHPDPIQLLKTLHRALKPGGLLVMESIIIDGEGDMCLFPEERYAAMRNVWFVPTLSAMRHMMARTRFTDLKTISRNRHEVEEQRTTSWNPGHSYENFLDSQDPSKTCEGYPAPHRAIVFGTKKG